VHRRRHVIAVVVVTVVAAGLSASVAAAQDLDDAVATEEPQDASPLIGPDTRPAEELPPAETGADRGPECDPSSPPPEAKGQIDHLVNKYGITETEAAVRLSRQAAVSELAASAALELGDRYAAVWIDHHDGGRVKIAVTQAGASAGARDQFVDPEKVDEVVVRRSFAFLDRLMRDFLALDDDLPQRSRVFGGVDNLANRLVVDIPRAVREDPAEAVFVARAEDFARRHSDDVQLGTTERESVEEACTGPESCDPLLRGGVRIDPANNPACSIGFVAQDSAGQLYALTSGHCLYASSWRHPNDSGHLIGPTSGTIYDDGTSVDAQKVAVSRPHEWSPQNWVMTSGTNALTIRSTIATVGIAQGQTVCRSGYRSIDCGEIGNTATSSGGNYPVVEIDDTCAIPGDSGGPVVDNANQRAYGMHIGSDNNTNETCVGVVEDSYFSPIRDVELALGANVLIRHGPISRPAVQRGIRFYMRQTSTQGAADFDFDYGNSGDLPLFCDWDGDGDQTIGVYRRSTSSFYLRNSNTTGAAEISFGYGGDPGDDPICGDWDDDGDETIGVKRGDQWLLRNSNTAGSHDVPSFAFGLSSDEAIVGDWNGDGRDSPGVMRQGSPHLWYLRDSNSGGAANYSFDWASGVGYPGAQQCYRRDTAGFTAYPATWSVRKYTSSTDTNCLASFVYGDYLDVPIFWK
jgi:hypothetical protein